MSRKHFQAIAEIISKIQDAIERRRVAEGMAEVCGSANQQFNRTKFLEACNAAQ